MATVLAPTGGIRQAACSNQEPVTGRYKRNCLEKMATGIRSGAQFVHTRWKRSPEFALYVFFGGLNFVLSYAIYVVCLGLMGYRMAYTVTSGCGVLISYFFNAQFVFKQRLRLTTALQFIVVYFVQYLVGLSLLYALVEMAHVSKLISPILILFVIVPINYALNRRVIKGRAKNPANMGSNPFTSRSK